MIEERVALSLDNMRRAALDATSFLSGMSQAEFLEDDKAQLACAMCLVIVGESTSKIEKRFPEFVSTHPDLPWDQMRGLRNRIVHDYVNLDLSTIWLTVRDHLPKLIASIAELGELDPRLAAKDGPHNAS